MRSLPVFIAIGLGVLSAPARSQFSSAAPPKPKVHGISISSGPGGFLMGADDCATPHNSAGIGDVFGVPFTTGTTGTTGQAEVLCYSFGTTGVTNDVWFGWVANSTGNGTITTCAGTTVDTKIAVWPNNEPSSCPADGASLGCNDDDCGPQSSVTWSVIFGRTYTFQIGTFPGAAGGSGTFDVTQSGLSPCGHDDDGTTEDAFGLTAGGEIGWIYTVNCIDSFTAIYTAYGSPMVRRSITDGNVSRIAIYEDYDNDGNPTTGSPRLVATARTVVTNGGTDILNYKFLPTRIHRNPATPHKTTIVVTADHVAGEHPGPMDLDNPTPNAWVVGSTLGPGTLDLQCLNNNVPPLQMQAIGLPTAWLVRPIPDGTGTWTPDCFGDGTGYIACPCGNDGGAGTGGGCANAAPMPAGQGAVLRASGTNSVAADDLVLTADFTTNQPGLFFQGNNAINGGNGIAFGDGLRCCGQNVVRLEIADPPGTSGPKTISTTAAILGTSPPGTTTAGDTRCYQWWYRNPGRSLCGNNFNLSNSVIVTWTP